MTRFLPKLNLGSPKSDIGASLSRTPSSKFLSPHLFRRKGLADTNPSPRMDGDLSIHSSSSMLSALGSSDSEISRK